MKLRTKMQAWRDGKTIPVAPDTSKSFFMMEHDAAAAHAPWLAIVGSVDSNSSLARADALLIAADKIMAEWGFDK